MTSRTKSAITSVAAIDLGATSGRIIVGQYNGDSLKLTEVHRFPNSFYELGNNCYWNLGGIWQEIRKGLKEAIRLFPDLRSVGVDTWGVDHVLLNDQGRIIFPTHAYRDERTNDLLHRIKASGDQAKLYDYTGLPAINYNTGLQLHESLQAFPALADQCKRVLMLPDYFNYLLSGKMVNEISEASTSQLLDVQSCGFSRKALDYFGIPAHWFQQPAKAGSLLGTIINQPGLENVQVALTPGHDTSCAFEAIPQDGQSMIVSSGTWLLAGAITPGPCLGADALKLGISNERTGQGGYRPNKILLGLWLLERLQMSFNVTLGPRDWDAIARQAAELDPPAQLLDISDEALFNPADMRKAIDAQLIAKNGALPNDLPGYTRLICESLAAAVAHTAAHFADLSGVSFDSIVIVGGGSKNELLCQTMASAAGMPVVSYQLEASSVGNIAYQLLALGVIEDLHQIHSVIRTSMSRIVYQP